jgi:branched-chain amino acid aminotransferase
MTVWLNSGLVDDAHAVVSVFDRGLTVGDGVFETLKVVAGQPFAVTRHLRRLSDSARGLGLDAPDLDLIRKAISEVVAADAESLGPLARVRITYTAGPSPLGSSRGDGPPTLIVAVSPSAPWPATTAIATVPWRRNEHSAVAGLKTTAYADNVVALARAKQLGASEAILANTAGDVCEGTGSNIFVVRDGVATTPPLSSGALPGITRELVLEWTAATEGVVSMADLGNADEVFLTSSTRDLHPVHSVDGRTLVAPGPVTASIAAAFELRSREGIDP